MNISAIKTSDDLSSKEMSNNQRKQKPRLMYSVDDIINDSRSFDQNLKFKSQPQEQSNTDSYQSTNNFWKIKTNLPDSAEKFKRWPLAEIKPDSELDDSDAKILVSSSLGENKPQNFQTDTFNSQGLEVLVTNVSDGTVQKLIFDSSERKPKIRKKIKKHFKRYLLDKILFVLILE